MTGIHNELTEQPVSDLLALTRRLAAVEAELAENTRVIRGGFERFNAILERGETMFEQLQKSKAFRMMAKS